MTEALVKKKIELLTQQKAIADRLNGLLNAPGGFNEISRKTCKNLEAAITASKRPGYFSYYDQPQEAKTLIRSDEVRRLQEQIANFQKQIDQLTESIDAATEQQQQQMQAALLATTTDTSASPKKRTERAQSTPSSSSESTANVQSLKQWFTAYGSPKQTTSDLYTNFTPDRKVYGGTSHYAAFKSQASTMTRGRLTK